MREGSDLFGRSLAANKRLEVGGALNEALPFGLRRQAQKPCRNRCSKLIHFGIFGLALDPAGLNGTTIIDRHIVEQPPRGLHISRIGHRRGGDEQGNYRGQKANRERRPDHVEETHYRCPRSRNAPVTIS